MVRKTVVLVVSMLVLLATFSGNGASAVGAPTRRGASLEPPSGGQPNTISVTACGTRITTVGAKARLDANLDCAGFPVAIYIEADKVQLDLNDHIITGDQSVNQRGIQVSNGLATHTKVEIKGPGVVQGFFTGIYLGHGNRHSVSNVTIADNTHTGVFIHHASANEISGNAVFKSVRGVMLQGNPSAPSNDNQVTNNRLIGNTQNGVQLSDAHGNEVSDNTLLDNKIGIEFFGANATGNSVTSNMIGFSIISANIPDGISGNDITDNTFFSYLLGIIDYGAPDNTIAPNIFQ